MKPRAILMLDWAWNKCAVNDLIVCRIMYTGTFSSIITPENKNETCLRKCVKTILHVNSRGPIVNCTVRLSYSFMHHRAHEWMRTNLNFFAYHNRMYQILKSRHFLMSHLRRPEKNRLKNSSNKKMRTQRVSFNSNDLTSTRITDCVCTVCGLVEKSKAMLKMPMRPIN